MMKGRGSCPGSRFEFNNNSAPLRKVQLFYSTIQNEREAETVAAQRFQLYFSLGSAPWRTKCGLTEKYLEQLRAEQANRRFTITRVLLGKGTPGMAFSLQAFCQNLCSACELLGDEVVRELVAQRVS